MAPRGGEPIATFAEVDGLRSYKDPTLRSELEHQSVSKKVRTNVTSGSCGSWVLIRNRAPSARERSISVPAVGGVHRGVAVTSTKPRAVEAGADRAA
jgi:hypothetical protein